MKTKSATTQPAAKPATKAAPCSCGCRGGSSGGECTCGKPVCFERPHYFGGQLLNDSDLTAEQSYFREKQKLYHRALHGYGVVCGLRLTCDADCCDHIRIGDGYAIDDCGNDLVVCQSTSFNVIQALRDKNLLLTEPTADPCEDDGPPDCKVKQCFYVTICYDEEQSEFTTPFKTNCGPGAAACEPTRIKETVRFEVADHAPKQRSYLDELEERIECSWKVFTEGPLARALKEYLCDDARRARGDLDYCQVFCQLQVLFKHYLKRHPDLYDCRLLDQVGTLSCPKDDRQNYEGYREAFCKLFELMSRYAYDSILGEMIFPCPNPSRARCVGLGTVEVEDGKVLRVCNCPRTYVTSFANIFEVLLATVVGGAACSSHPRSMVPKPRPSESVGAAVPSTETPHHERHHKASCCASFDFDCEQFLTLLCQKPEFGKIAATAPVRAIRSVMESMQTGFQFSDSLAFSPEIFKGMNKDDAKTLAEKLAGRNQPGGSVFDPIDPQHYETPDPITSFLRHLLRRPGDALVFTQTQDKQQVATVLPRSQLPVAVWDKNEMEKRVKAAEDMAAGAKASAESLDKQVKAKQQELDDLKSQVAMILDKFKQPAAGPPALPPGTPMPPADGGTLR